MLVYYFNEELKYFISNKIKVNYVYFIYSVIVLLVTYIIQGAVWYLITYFSKCNINFKDTLILYLYLNGAKYFPGKLLPYIILFNFYSKEKKNIARITLSITIEHLISALSSILMLCLGGSGLLVKFLDLPIEILYISLFVLMAVFISFLHPVLLNFLNKKICNFLKKEYVYIEISYKNIFSIFSLECLRFVFLTFAHLLFFSAFYSISINSFMTIMFIISISNFISYIFFFLPAGIGSREGVYLVGLMMLMPKRVASMASLTSRLWITFTDILIVVIAFLVDFFNKRFVYKRMIGNSK
jgi:hypothetical protein